MDGMLAWISKQAGVPVTAGALLVVLSSMTMALMCGTPVRGYI